MLHRFDDELIITGEVEPGTAGARVGQLYQWLVANGVLKFRMTQGNQRNKSLQSNQRKVTPLSAESRRQSLTR